MSLLLALMTLEGPALSSVVTVGILATIRGVVREHLCEVPIEEGAPVGTISLPLSKSSLSPWR